MGERTYSTVTVRIRRDVAVKLAAAGELLGYSLNQMADASADAIVKLVETPVSARRQPLLIRLVDAALHGSPLPFAVDAPDTEADTQTPVTLRAALDALLAAKAAAQRRPSYVASLSVLIGQFIRGREQMRLGAITTADVEAWVAAGKSANSRATRLSRLSTLFAFAVRRGWLATSPCARVERITLDRHAPVILTLTQCRQLLDVTRERYPNALPTVALGLLAGVRPHEISRVTWVDLDLDRALLTIGAAASKVRQRRLVDISANCVAWLRLGGDLPLRPDVWRYTRRRLADALGLKWVADVLRHTAASMMLARDQDAGKVALQLGNSPAVLLTHYRELVTRETAAEFWKMVPAA